MKLVEFLKKYSKISDKFITDFFGFVDVDDRFGFNVNLDKIAMWFKIQ